MAYFRKVSAKNNKGYTWSFTLDLGRDPSTGKRKQITRRGFETKKEAEQVAATITHEIEKETFIREKDILFKDFITDFLELVAKSSVKPSTFSGYTKVVNKRLIKSFGHMKLKSLTPHLITKYYNDLLSEGLTPEYIQYIHSILKSSSKVAVEWKYIKNNFMDHVKAPRRTKKNVETWSIEECNTFLNRMRQQKEHIFMLYYLALYTGMRRGEILGLKWQDIDFEDKRIYVRNSLYYVSGQGLVLQSTKTKSGNRNIAITKEDIRELKAYKIKKQEQLLQVGMNLTGNHFVISAFGGEPVNPNTIHKQFLYDIKLAGVKRIRFHDLRHTHATIMLEIGENSKVVSERLGHANTSITLDKYSHVTQNLQKSSAENYSKALRTDQLDN
ncbi:tyrosine-type recombinase/integrase [Bacillus haynesii]|uniref:site-specific integrase n=1 Tax=Bacillus haynesii TaxID=1925021 RepID=UPI002280A800|nr:tyrosine-type recombinase/integrase [Bacillus haynesii]MCY8144339.1 site-specific integrase [Bacillus haynesii]MEC1455361.1 tyrosine-type recombinase/integrase [Bacillus haynesii]MEC1571357.1 tyrosine-type recombinase/integrase [Bacillus haynesii]